MTEFSEIIYGIIYTEAFRYLMVGSALAYGFYKTGYPIYLKWKKRKAKNDE